MYHIQFMDTDGSAGEAGAAATELTSDILMEPPSPYQDWREGSVQTSEQKCMPSLKPPDC